MTFIVRNDEGKQMQVGSSCVKDFLGHEVSLPALAKAVQEEIHDDLLSLGREFLGIYDLHDFLQRCACRIREWGFVPSRDRENPNGTTAEQVWFGNHGMPNDADRKIAAEAIEWARESKPKNNYEDTLKVLAEEGIVTKRLRGFAASIIPAYLRESEKKDEVPAVVEGRQKLEGKVLNLKSQSCMYSGKVMKMLVQDAQGRRYWGSFPSGFKGGIGDGIAMAATVTASKDDKGFGFFKQPKLH